MGVNCKSSCKYLTKVLRSLIQRAERDDVRTVEALLEDMTGSRVAGLMLHHLLRWWPNASNPDGWVYKSHADWWAELRIKQSELPRANGALERVGVISQTKKANGAPTKHYRLDQDQFWSMVGQTLKIEVNAFSEMLQNAFADSQEMDFANGSKSITTSPATTPSNTAVLLGAIQEAKKVRGVSDATARLWVSQYGAARVRVVARMILSRTWKISAAGAMRRALQEQWECEPEDMQNPDSLSEGDDAAKWKDDPSHVVPSPTDEKEPPVPGQRNISTNDTEPDIDVNTEPTPDPDATEPIDPTCPEAKAWATLQGSMDERTFDTCLRRAKLLRVDGSTWFIQAQNPYALNQLSDHRMVRLVRRVLALPLNIAPESIELRFEVAQKAVV